VNFYLFASLNYIVEVYIVNVFDSVRRMEEIKCSEKVSNEQVLDRIGEKRTLINNILRRKANWMGHILRRNYLLHDAIEGQMKKMKGVERRTTQLLDDLRNRRRYLGAKGGS
jgi:hypothetical protein